MPLKDKQEVLEGIAFGLNKDDSFIMGSYITFRREWAQEVGKVTKIWVVNEGKLLHGTILGQVRWFPRWRKYGLFTEGGMVFEETCLREIGYFCETATKIHKAALKERKAASA
jgi:hypothetical protein